MMAHDHQHEHGSKCTFFGNLFKSSVGFLGNMYWLGSTIDLVFNITRTTIVGLSPEAIAASAFIAVITSLCDYRVHYDETQQNETEEKMNQYQFLPAEVLNNIKLPWKRVGYLIGACSADALALAGTAMSLIDNFSGKKFSKTAQLMTLLGVGTISGIAVVKSDLKAHTTSQKRQEAYEQAKIKAAQSLLTQDLAPSTDYVTIPIKMDESSPYDSLMAAAKADYVAMPIEMDNRATTSPTPRSSSPSSA